MGDKMSIQVSTESQIPKNDTFQSIPENSNSSISAMH